MRVLNRYVFDSMAKIPVKIKTPAGQAIDPITKKTTTNYIITNTWASKLRVSDEEIKNSNGIIDYDTVKLMITSDIDPDAVIEYDGKNYRIKILKDYDGAKILYLTEA